MSQPRHCVIVDDVRAYRLQIRKWLRSDGFECTEVGRAKQAWNVLRQQGADLVITDIDMPQMSGFQLIRNIRSLGANRLNLLPIIVVSGLCDIDIDRFVQQMGATRFVPKPLERGYFQTVVAAVMREQFRSHRRSRFQTSALEKNFPQISPVLRRLAREALERPTTECIIDRDTSSREREEVRE